MVLSQNTEYSEGLIEVVLNNVISIFYKNSKHSSSYYYLH